MWYSASASVLQWKQEVNSYKYKCLKSCSMLRYFSPLPLLDASFFSCSVNVKKQKPGIIRTPLWLLPFSCMSLTCAWSQTTTRPWLPAVTCLIGLSGQQRANFRSVIQLVLFWHNISAALLQTGIHQQMGNFYCMRSCFVVLKWLQGRDAELNLMNQLRNKSSDAEVKTLNHRAAFQTKKRVKHKDPSLIDTLKSVL